jgi:hypothetical protein
VIEFEFRSTDPRDRGGPDLALRLRAINEKVRQEIRDAVEEAAGEAVTYATRKVPYSFKPGDHPQEHLRDTIRKTDSIYRPGGAGGGGFFESTVQAGGRNPKEWPNPFWLLEGTGIFGSRHKPIHGRWRGDIRRYNPMGPGFWHGRGGWFWNETKGQRPQREWWYGARERALFILATASKKISLDV